MTDLRLFDLNLLVAFDALVAERSVTRAARRVGIGQPAMSHALSRLRELFGDPLFVRTTDKMRPTTRALELAAPIARVLADIRESVLADRAFAPDRAEMTFRVGASDHSEIAVLPTVLSAVRSLAPKVRIAVSTVDRDRLDTMLESGAVDLAIGYFPDPPNARTSEVLFREEFVCLFDAKACGASSPLKLKTYLELPHIIMSLRGQLSGDADTVIGRGGGKRFVFMATPHFLAIPFLLHGFRAVAAVPRRLAENCADVAGLDISPLPIAMDGYDVSMQWHSRTETDPAQRWFRELVRVSGRSKAPASRPRSTKGR
jgi:LysR family transcriptional regulator, mexEF-oprN operon transcriptional activator